jgi:hypothetical protein
MPSSMNISAGSSTMMVTKRAQRWAAFRLTFHCLAAQDVPYLNGSFTDTPA